MGYKSWNDSVVITQHLCESWLTSCHYFNELQQGKKKGLIDFSGAILLIGRDILPFLWPAPVAIPVAEEQN